MALKPFNACSVETHNYIILYITCTSLTCHTLWEKGEGPKQTGMRVYILY